jgi:hypothetical protein
MKGKNETRAPDGGDRDGNRKVKLTNIRNSDDKRGKKQQAEEREAGSTRESALEPTHPLPQALEPDRNGYAHDGEKQNGDRGNDRCGS